MSDRHTFRADWHHYNSGVFFVTICANHMEHIFGNIINNQMHFSAAGKIVKECVCDIPNHHKNVTVGNYVVMPNHVHCSYSALCRGAIFCARHHNAEIKQNDGLYKTSSSW